MNLLLSSLGYQNVMGTNVCDVFVISWIVGYIKLQALVALIEGRR